MSQIQEFLSGGLSKGKPPKNVSKKEILRGTRVEFEHTDDLEIARKIAYDHLTEEPSYYKKLEKMEKKTKKASNENSQAYEIIVEAENNGRTDTTDNSFLNLIRTKNVSANEAIMYAHIIIEDQGDPRSALKVISEIRNFILSLNSSSVAKDWWEEIERGNKTGKRAESDLEDIIKKDDEDFIEYAKALYLRNRKDFTTRYKDLYEHWREITMKRHIMDVEDESSSYEEPITKLTTYFNLADEARKLVRISPQTEEAK
jgi:hypothetical protein